MVQEICQEHHEWLITEGVLCRMTDGAQVGLLAVKIRLIPVDIAQACEIDEAYLLTVAQMAWDEWNDAQRRAYIDNALCACALNEKTEVPCLAKPPAIWPQAIERHGALWSYEAMEYRGAVNEAQLRFPEMNDALTQSVSNLVNSVGKGATVTLSSGDRSVTLGGDGAS